MKDGITPGSQIQIKVVKQPTNAAAGKTLVRLMSKSHEAKVEAARQRRIREEGYNPKRRGGRLYGGRIVKQEPVQIQVGLSRKIRATLDVITDLGSVSRFVEVKPA